MGLADVRLSAVVGRGTTEESSRRTRPISLAVVQPGTLAAAR